MAPWGEDCLPGDPAVIAFLGEAWSPPAPPDTAAGASRMRQPCLNSSQVQSSHSSRSSTTTSTLRFANGFDARSCFSAFSPVPKSSFASPANGPGSVLPADFSLPVAGSTAWPSSTLFFLLAGIANARARRRAAQPTAAQRRARGKTRYLSEPARPPPHRSEGIVMFYHATTPRRPSPARSASVRVVPGAQRTELAWTSPCGGPKLTEFRPR